MSNHYFLPNQTIRHSIESAFRSVHWSHKHNPYSPRIDRENQAISEHNAIVICLFYDEIKM